MELIIKAHWCGKLRNVSSIDFISETVTIGRTKHHTARFEDLTFLSPFEKLNIKGVK